MSATMVDPAPSDPIFGRIVTGYDVEDAATTMLKRWLDTYLAEMERRYGIPVNSVARPRSWQVAPTFDKWPENQLPAMIVQSTGLAGVPTRRAGRRYDARFLIGVGAVCSAKTEELSHFYALIYIAAVRAAINQHPSLEGFATSADWTNEDYTPLPFDDARSLHAGLAMFSIEVAEVLSANAGPPTPNLPGEPANDPLPDNQPWPEWPRAETVDVDVNKVDDVTEGR